MPDGCDDGFTVTASQCASHRLAGELCLARLRGTWGMSRVLIFGCRPAGWVDSSSGKLGGLS